MTTRARNRRSRVGGFTLIEALVATALMGILLTSLATITAQWMPNWNRGMARIQRNENLAVGLDRLASDLAAAEFITAGRETLQPLFEGASQSVVFVRTAFSPNAHPGLEIVRYVEDSANGLVRTRAQFVPITKGINDHDRPRFVDPVALIGKAYRVSFSYSGSDRIWHDSWRQESELPKAIRVTIREAHTRHILAASTALLLHVASPVDCINAKSQAECLALRQPNAQSAGSPTARAANSGSSP